MKGGKHAYRGGAEYDAKKAASRAIAEENTAEWQALSPREQLKALDARFGVGVGATKQRLRIQAAIARGGVS